MNLKKLGYKFALLIVGVIGTESQAATIRVPQDQSTIAAAIATAQEGDTVLVSSGLYQEHNLTITNGISVQSANGSSVTTIDGQQIGGTRVFTVNSASANLASISGFSIINGNASPAQIDGAGVHWIAGPLIISDCVFSNNYANGGIVGTTTTPLDPTKLKMMDCVFKNNTAENLPGVIGATVVRCLFYNNSAWNNPSALASCNATNCTIYGNTGGVLSNPWTTGGISGGTAVNCIVWGNSGYNGQQVDQTTPTTVSYSIVQGGYSGTGNLSSDPLFVNTATSDFHLQPNSAAIHAGDPAIFNSDGSRSDIGAYGGVFIECSPHRALATVQVVNGFVVGATIINPGCGYTNAPVVLIQGGNGEGATATATVSDGQVTKINITGSGIGYTGDVKIVIASPPFVPSVSIAVSKVKVTQNVVLGRNYVLESSSNLVTWTATGPQFTADSESIVTEFDVDVTGHYYRIRQVP